MSRLEFLASLGFTPDRFQSDAFDAFDRHDHVIVAAPTGAGKTLVASYGIDQVLARGGRVFYTTPIKALSNQKFRDLVDRYGRAAVGLLTGDNAINGEAPVVVMTTEVLRNMLYAGRRLTSLEAVVLDEVHYLQDSYRGPVWEEVIIHLPHRIQLVALSATVSNAAELAEWIETVRGPTSLVVETKRPVELENRYLIGERGSAKLHLIKTLNHGKANAKGFRFDAELNKGRNRHGPKGPKGRPKRRWQTPRRTDVVQLLRQRELLPAIYFLFSRAACTEAALAVLDAGIVLTSDSERVRIRRIADERLGGLSAIDRDVLGHDRFLRALEAGVASHHAGMVPPMKETVEACFEQGLVKAVFATETLALGINMPARTVVIEKLTKWTGEGHEFLSPAQYTQLTGRAGRRGIDDHGDAIVLWSPWTRFEQVADLAASREYVLRSAFRPTYNMAANLVRRYDADRARQLLNLSFAQFRADAEVVRVEHRLETMRNRHHQVEQRLIADFGPLDELRAALDRSEAIDADTTEIADGLSRLRPGDVIEVASDAIASNPVVVLAVAYRKRGRIKVLVADGDADSVEITADDLDRVPTQIGSVPVVDPYLPHSMTFVFDMAKAMNKATFRAGDRKRKGSITMLSVAADVPAAARKGLRRLEKMQADIDEMSTGVDQRVESLGLQFDRVIELLTERGHLEGWALTESGERLARVYHELDLFIVEALDEGVFDDLEPSEVAALTSCFVYEDRRSGAKAQPWFPTRELRRRFGALERLHNDLARTERRQRLDQTRQPDAGFMAVAHAWTAGGDLDDVLDDEELTGGDFVRTARLLIDLLGQIGGLAPDPRTRRAARSAAEAFHRDLVAASAALDLDSADEPDPVEVAEQDPGDTGP